MWFSRDSKKCITFYVYGRGTSTIFNSYPPFAPVRLAGTNHNVTLTVDGDLSRRLEVLLLEVQVAISVDKMPNKEVSIRVRLTDAGWLANQQNAFTRPIKWEA